MPRTTKGHNYVNFSWNSLKNKSGNLYIIPNQHIIFQDPSLSTFRDILLTRSKRAELQRVVTLSIFSWNSLKIQSGNLQDLILIFFKEV